MWKRPNPNQLTPVKTSVASPATTKGVAVHLSYNPKTNEVAYANTKAVLLVNLDKPNEARQFNGHIAPTTVAKFSPSGFYVCSADQAGNVKVWDPISFNIKYEAKIGNGRINDLSWDADSQRIIAVGDGSERYGHCFTFDTGNTVGEISGHGAQVNAVAIKPTRPYRAATVGDDSTLVFYKGPPFKFDHTVKQQHSNYIHDVAFSPDGNWLVSVGADRKVVLYDKEAEPVKTIDAHAGSIYSVSWAQDSTHFATASADNTVKVFNVEGKEVESFKFDQFIVGVVWADDFLVSVGLDGTLSFSSVSIDALAKLSLTESKVIAHQQPISAVETIKGKIYSGSVDGSILEWTGDKAAPSDASHSTYIVSLSDCAGSLASVAWDDTYKLDNSVYSIGTQPKAADSRGSLSAVVTENTLHILDKGKLVKKVSIDRGSAVAIADQIVVGSKSGELTVYSTSGEKAFDLPPLRAAATKLALSENGNLLAAGESTGKIILYDLSTKSVVTSRWTFHTAQINDIDWLGNDYIASVSLDTNIYIYSVKTPMKNLKSLNAHKEGATAVRWLANNELVTGGADAVLKWWTVELS